MRGKYFERAVPPAPTLKRALVRRVAEMARRMHRGGVNHRDFYICHFLLHLPVDTAAPKLSLIDLHRAQVRKQVPRRWRDKDLAAYRRSTVGLVFQQFNLLPRLTALENVALPLVYAGISKKTIYQAFSGKNEILHQVVSNFLACHRQGLSRGRAVRGGRARLGRIRGLPLPTVE